ncbi:7127_t:CDS:2 [Scutellospora calospora]|uniref:7127_t:CDS:1 n=1 Tax=Scutellospora calospora TaxID=85575 RepID=A0ACA9JXC1_9GLOM|nr:7127_t:CDS:2 [Scutellospora calospora]
MLTSPLNRSARSETVVDVGTHYPACDECYEYQYNHHNPSFYCQPCNTKRFRQDFDKWSTGNDKLDRLIQRSQTKSKNIYELLEWIPYSNLKEITRISQGGFATVFSAIWVDGPMQRFDLNKQQWSRAGISMVVFKEFHNSKDSSFEFLEEDPKSKNYGIVMKYASLGSLRRILNESFHEKSWDQRFDIILEISSLFEIFMGRRPQLPKETPSLLKKLFNKCWDANPDGRPTMQQIHKELERWKHRIRDVPASKIYKEFKIANEDWKRNSNVIRHPILEVPEGSL